MDLEDKFLAKASGVQSLSSSVQSTPEKNGHSDTSRSPELLLEFVKSCPRKDLFQTCSDKEKKHSASSKCKMAEQLPKTSKKTIKNLEAKKASPSPKGQPSKMQNRKAENPIRLPVAAEQCADFKCANSLICKNSACRAILSVDDTFCKRCSCCICHLFDDNKDPSLWLECTSESGQGDSCGLSCHLECALQHEKVGVVDLGQLMQLDGSYCCASCGKVSGILGCWKKQLTIAKDTRRVDVLCYRIYLSYRLLDGTSRFKDLHEIVREAKAKLETEVGPLNGVLIKMARGIVSRLSIAGDLRTLCSLAIEKADECLATGSSSMPNCRESAGDITLSANSGEAIPSHHPGTTRSLHAGVINLDMGRDPSGICEEGSDRSRAGDDGPNRKISQDDEPSEITEDSKGYSSEPPATSMLRSKRKRVGFGKNLVKGEASHDQKGKENMEVAESKLMEWCYLEPTWPDLSREEMELLASEVTQKTQKGKLLYPLEMRFMEYYRLLAWNTLPPGDYSALLSEGDGMKEIKEKIRALELEAEALSRRKDVLHLLSSYSMKPEVAIDVFTLTSIFSRINGYMRDLFVHSGENNGQVDYITCRNIISRRIPELFWDVKALLTEAAFDTVPYLAEGMVQNMSEPRLWPEGEFPAPQAMYTLASDSAIRQAMKCIQERTFRSIGISGIGGKEVAKALTNLPEIRNTFSVVLFVSISQHLSIRDVERQIKQQIHVWRKRTKGIDISVPVNVPFQHYNCLLLLDCIDEPINLYALDIPGPSKTGFRFHVQTVLTTESQIAYRVMPVDLEIRMEDHLLPWDLFCKNLGHSSTVDFSSLKPMAVRLVEECHGHLLAIILLARALSGVKDGGVWELALHELTSELSSEIGGISKDMENVLRFIWQREGNATKHCIKYCTSHDKGTLFLRDSLISGWIRAGSIKTQEEGDDILKDLISSFLLEEFGETSIRMREEIRLVLLNRFILRPHPVYLMQGSAGLTEAPELKEWDAEEIHLMNNKLSEVPESPTCLFLQKLFLQINYDLTEIPLSFFEHMPVLQVLDLSSTSLKSLPPSISRLVALRELYLRDCELLMELPPEIGALWNLKVLDLDRTEVIRLPREIEYLVNLECFKVSFYGCTAQHTNNKKLGAASPRMLLSELTKLKELSIDVNPDCVGWYIEVAAIMNELSSLSNLETLKLYIPTIELLQQFLQLTWSKNQLMIFPSLSHFTLKVGRHVQRIISYLPDDLEEKFEKLSKSKLPFSLEKSGYLKYTNGETNTDIIAKALKNASALFLDRHWTMGKLSVFKIDEISKLKYCLLVECSEMQTIVDGSDYYQGDTEGDNEEDREMSIEFDGGDVFPKCSTVSDKNDEDDDDGSLKDDDYDDEGQYDLDLGERPALPSLQYLSIRYMKSLESIWKGPTVRGCLSYLKILALHTCPKLTTIFTPGLLANLIYLKAFVAEDCSIISSLVSLEPSNSKLDSFLPSLKTISLLDLPELVNISCGLRIAPNLDRMVIYNCPKLESLLPVEVSSKYMKEIKGESEWWDALKWPESEWCNGRPDYLVRTFVPLRRGGDLMDQLATAADSFEELM